MGGHFAADGGPEHNIVSDITAARAVFASGLPTVVTGLEITRRVRSRHRMDSHVRAP
ncbi:hypothetical protein [Streptomyces sp. NPDC055140]